MVPAASAIRSIFYRDTRVCSKFPHVYRIVKHKFAMSTIGAISSRFTWLLADGRVFYHFFFFIMFCCRILKDSPPHVFHNLSLHFGWVSFRDFTIFSRCHFFANK